MKWFAGPGRLRKGGIVSTTADLLREVLRMGDESGVSYVRRAHIPEETFARLAYLTHDHALTVGREGSTAGERIYDGGIQSWWRNEASYWRAQLQDGALVASQYRRGRVYPFRAIVRRISALFLVCLRASNGRR